MNIKRKKTCCYILMNLYILAKSTDLEVTCVAINSNLVVASSMEQFLVWQYKTSKGSLRVTCNIYI